MTDNNLIEMIIETPKGSGNKYIWDEEKSLVRLKKAMPSGFVFPFDFGMIADTVAEDGDPIDVLLLMQQPAFPGVLATVRIIGALKADQKKEEKNRNDRLIAVLPTCPVFGSFDNLKDIPQKLQEQITGFFEAYNRVQGKEFTSLGWADADEAMELIKKASI